MTSALPCLRLIAGLSSVAVAATALANARVEESVVAPFQAGAAYIMSPAGLRVATITMRGSRHVILVDGVAGPLFDQKLQINGKAFYERNSGMNISGQLPPMVFSADGQRFAYCGRLGDEIVIVVDGKESVRLPNRQHSGLFDQGPLGFSPGGKHFYYVYNDGSATRLVMNGQAGPEIAFGSAISIVFSPDDKRWAYATMPVGKRDEMMLIVDGKEAKYVAGPVAYSQLVFQSDGKLVCVATAKDGASVLVDGKPVVRAASIPEVAVSAKGGRLAAFIVKPGQAQPALWLDGKEIAGTDGVAEVLFSPDGKRYAAVVGRPGRQWVVADGRKQNEYAGVRGNKNRGALFGISFTADSSKLVYTAGSGSAHFVVVEGEESDGFQSTPPRVSLSAKGAHIAYHGQAVTDSFQQRTVVVDGRKYQAPNTIVHDSLTFSPDGSRHAWRVSRVSPDYVFVDGQELGFNRASMFFSPDGKHVVVAGTQEKTNQYGLFVNGTLVHDGKKSGNLRDYRAFTPDSRHLYWTAATVEGGKVMNWTLYLDGQPTVTFTRPHSSIPFIPTAHFRGGDEYFDRIPNAWQMADDGTLTFLEWTGDAVKRFRVTPSRTTSVATLLAGGSTPPSTTSATTVPAKAAASVPVATRTAAATATPVTAVAAGPAVTLSWNDLVRRVETRPATCTINKEFNFQGGAKVRAGTKVNIVEFKPDGLVVGTQDGRTNFAIKPADCDVLEVASAAWSQLTPAQRELTHAALLKRMDLWPYRVKLAVPIELEGRRLAIGSPVLLQKVDGSQLLVRIEGTLIAFNVGPEQTDLMAQARGFLADERGAPGRVMEEFAGKVMNPVDSRPVTLDASVRPKYVVMYMGAGWCAPCLTFSPKLVKLIRDKAPKPSDVSFFYLSGDKTPAEMKAYTTKMGITWPTISYKSSAQLPAFAPLFGNVIPQLVVTDRHGKTLIDSNQGGYDRALSQLAALLQ
jgi:thiol-disulfide isomerase/thioredoxin